MNNEHRKPLPGTTLDYFDTREAVDAIEPGAYDKLPYTSRVLAENLVRRCDPAMLTDALKQLIERRHHRHELLLEARQEVHDATRHVGRGEDLGERDRRQRPRRSFRP